MSRRTQTRRLVRLLLVAGVMLMVLMPAAAMADSNYPPTTTATTRQCAAGSTSGVCRTVATVPKRGGSLPFTGGNIAVLTALGLVIAVVGGSLVWLGRRSDSAA